MIQTQRKCNICGYQTFVIHDKKLSCKHCRIGNLEIIVRGEFKEKK